MTTITHPEIGEPAPVCGATGQDGATVELSALWTRKPLVLVFLPDAKTPLCGDNAAQLRDSREQFEQADGVVAAVLPADAPSAGEFDAQWNLPYVLLVDPEGALRAAFGLEPMQPASFVIDTGGVVRYAHRGGEPDDYPPTSEMVKAVCAITGREVKTAPPPPVQVDERPIVVEDGMIQGGAFVCPKCGHAGYEIHQVTATGGLLSRLLNFQLRGFTAITCNRCTYTELYQTETGAFANVLDLLIGR